VALRDATTGNRTLQLRGTGNVIIDTVGITPGGSANASLVVGGGTTSNAGFTVTLSVLSSYNGTTFVSSGRLITTVDAPLSADGAFGNGTLNSNPAVTIGDGSSNGVAAQLLTGGAVTIARSITVSNNAANTGLNTIGGNTDNNSTFSGNITAQRALRITQVATTGGNKLTLAGINNTGATGGVTFDNVGDVLVSGVIQGAPGIPIVKTSGGKLTFSGNNTYSGTTTISNGILQVGAGGTSGTLGTTGAVTNDTQILFNRIDSFTIGNAIGGTGAIDMQGTGTLVLTGANTYAGTTTVTAGTVQIGNGGTTGTLGGGAVTNNGVLAFNRSDTATVVNVISGTGAVTKLGTGTTILDAVNTYTGGTNIAAGTLQWGNTSAFGSTGNITFSGGTLQVNNLTAPALNGLVASGRLTATGDSPFSFDTNGESVSLTNPIPVVGSSGLTKMGDGVLTLAVANSFLGLTTVNGGALQYGLNDAIASGGVTVNGFTAVLDMGVFNDTVGVVTVNGGSIIGTGTLTGTGNFDFRSGSASVVLAGVVGAAKTTAGTMTLNAANTYSGLTTISAGTLEHGIDNALGSGDVTVNGATAVLALGAFNDSVGVVTLDGGGSITGSGTLTSTAGIDARSGLASAALAGAIGLTKTTAGTVTLAGDNTYTGLTTISNGILQVGDGGTTGTLGSNAGTITDNGTLAYNRSDTVTVANVISGTGAVTQNGAGTLNLNGTQSYATLNTNAGTTNLNSSFTAPATINANVDSTLNFTTSQSLTALNIGGPATFGDELGLADFGGPATAAVPEPGTMGLLVVGALGMLARRRRKA
jgi:autotransporter-associated beta strand protein